MLSHPRSKATKDHEGTEESKYYDTINEGPAYEAVGEGQSKTGGGDTTLSNTGEFDVKECPANNHAPTLRACHHKWRWKSRV